MEPIQLLSRTSESEAPEVGQNTPRPVVEMLDAVCIAEGKTRGQLVNEILTAWATKKAHEWNVIARITRSNPMPSEAAGKMAEVAQ